MFFEIIATVCIAFAGAGVVLLGFRLVGRKAPKALVFGAAGLAMILYTQWERYSWAERYAASLPADTHVVGHLYYDGWLEPWARVFPRADGVVVLDGTQTLTNDDYPHIRMVSTLLVERHQDTITLRQFVDCRQQRRAPVTGPVSFTEAGLPPAEIWVSGGEPRALYDAVCLGK